LNSGRLLGAPLFYVWLTSSFSPEKKIYILNLALAHCYFSGIGESWFPRTHFWLYTFASTAPKASDEEKQIAVFYRDFSEFFIPSCSYEDRDVITKSFLQTLFNTFNDTNLDRGYPDELDIEDHFIITNLLDALASKEKHDLVIKIGEWAIQQPLPRRLLYDVKGLLAFTMYRNPGVNTYQTYRERAGKLFIEMAKEDPSDGFAHWLAFHYLYTSWDSSRFSEALDFFQKAVECGEKFALVAIEENQINTNDFTAEQLDKLQAIAALVPPIRAQQNDAGIGNDSK